MQLGVVATCLLAAFITSCHGFKVFENCKVDLGVILDQSSSLGRPGFAQEKEFVKDLTNVVTIGDKGIIVSILKFSSAANMELYFKEAPARSKPLLDKFIDGIAIRGGLTQTHLAIDLAASEMFKNDSGQRNTVPKVLIVITDGQSQSGPAAVGASAKRLQVKGINMISIGVGALINKEELKMIASEPLASHVFTVSGTNDLVKIVSNVRQESCREIKCPYKTCLYGDWSSWAGSCGEAERFKTLRSMSEHTKVRVGGCAGLSNTCDAALRESKPLPNPCKKKCTISICKWSEWTDWMKTCGVTTRVAELMRSTIEVEADDCAKVQAEKGCKETKEFKQEERKTLCKCPTVNCTQGEWSSWTATCGHATRLRQTISKPITVESYFCERLPQACNSKVEDQQRFVPCAVEGPQETYAKKCNVSLATIGCFHDEMVVPRPMPDLILNERDRTHPTWNQILIDWKNWDTYYEEFVCRCANKAFSKGLGFIGVQFYGECWSGPEAGETYKKNGPSTNCIKAGFEKCQPADQSCIGADKANFVYMIEK